MWWNQSDDAYVTIQKMNKGWPALMNRRLHWLLYQTRRMWLSVFLHLQRSSIMETSKRCQRCDQGLRIEYYCQGSWKRGMSFHKVVRRVGSFEWIGWWWIISCLSIHIYPDSFDFIDIFREDVCACPIDLGQSPESVTVDVYGMRRRLRRRSSLSRWSL